MALCCVVIVTFLVFCKETSQPHRLLFHFLQRPRQSILICVYFEGVMLDNRFEMLEVTGQTRFGMLKRRVYIIHFLGEEVSLAFPRHEMEVDVRYRLSCSLSILDHIY